MPYVPSMVDPYGKMCWAKGHLDRLRTEVSEFSIGPPSKAYTITRKDDVENQRHVITVEFHDIPAKICLIVADAVYSMRAALDQMVWNLAALKAPPGHTQFPIIETLSRDSFKRFADNLFGIPDQAFIEIKALQPYHRGSAFKGDPLWRLNEICNLDKHRRIPAYGTLVSILANDVPGKTSEILYNRQIITIPIASREQFYFEPSGPVEVLFGGGDSGITETVDTLFEIHKIVESDVLPRFNRFFA